MNRFVVFLRGINVSGKNKVPMSQLKSLLERIGYRNVLTLLQTGNIRLDSPTEDREAIAAHISSEIEEEFGFSTPAIVKSVSEITKILADNPLDENIREECYFVLLKTKPRVELIESLASQQIEDQEFHISDDCVYLYCRKGYGRAKCTNNFFEKKLECPATTRNFNTLYKLSRL